MSGSQSVIVATPNGFEYQSILPPSVNIDRRMLLLEQLFAERLGALDLSVLLVYLIDHVEKSALIWLGKQFSLFGDGWEFANGEETQRALLKAAIEIHRYKGTPWAIKHTLAVLGYGDCELQERYGFYQHDGAINHDRNHRYGQGDSWTHYRLVMKRRITKEQADYIKSILDEVAPVRCKLISINLNIFKHDSTINHDGTYFYDEVIAQW